MDYRRQFLAGTLLFGLVALGHALVTWPLRSVLVLFVAGAAIAFVGEVLVIRLGLLRHHVGPQVLGVPLVVLLAWPSTVYVFYRAAALVVPAGVEAAALAAVAATLFDVYQDPVGVRRGLWTYPASRVSRPRFRDVPWWNFAGWLWIVFVTSMLTVVFG